MTRVPSSRAYEGEVTGYCRMLRYIDSVFSMYLTCTLSPRTQVGPGFSHDHIRRRMIRIVKAKVGSLTDKPAEVLEVRAAGDLPLSL
jgi:hypothetical protein